SGMIRVQQARQEVSGTGGSSADKRGLDRTAQPAGPDELSFEGSEDGKSDERDDDGKPERGKIVAHEHVGKQRDEATGDIRGCDGKSGTVGSIRSRLFESELEAHHEVDPGGRILFEGGQNGCGTGSVDGVLLEDLVDLFFFVLGALDNLALFAPA